MNARRLEAFTDGVIAIVITIMVLELKVPSGGALSDLAQSLPLLVAYAVSFVNVGLYWNNHHHLFQLDPRVDGRVLWANLFLLFWLSLVWTKVPIRSARPLPMASCWAARPSGSS